MNSDELIDQVQATYGSCLAYEDIGWMNRIGAQQGDPSDHISFRTWFVRPQHFRFDWSRRRPGDDHDMSVSVWSNEKGVYRKKTGQELETVADLAQLLQRCKGVSAMTCTLVPLMLLDDHNNFLASISQPSTSDVLQGVRPCHQLQGTDSKERRYSVEIEMGSLIVLRILMGQTVEPSQLLSETLQSKILEDFTDSGIAPQQVFASFQSESEYVYDQVFLDQEIPLSVFDGPQA